MKEMRKIKNYIYILAAVAIFYSCSPADGDFPGSEYIPDMAHSVAYEANVYNYYYLNTWDSASVFRLKELSNPRLPVKGTIARGYAGVYLNGEQTSDEVLEGLTGGNAANAISVPVNGNAPYYYADTEEERLRAMAEILDNPFPITAEGLAKGKELYDIFCGICHGDKGDGNGYLVREADPTKGDAGGVYPVLPANLLAVDYASASNGRYYHAMIYGKNVMGGYADKMDYEERWQVIHYVRSLQAKDQKLEYSETTNTLNPAFGTPVKDLPPMAANDDIDEDAHEEEGPEGDHSSDDDQDEGH